MLDVSRLPIELISIVRQLVEQGDINVQYPVTGDVRQWADFYNQHPDKCTISDRPYFYMYGHQYIDNFRTLKDRNYESTFRFGLDIPCDVERAHYEDVQTLWYTARSFFNARGGQGPMRGAYKVGFWEYTGVRLAELGIISTSFNNAVTYQAKNGKVMRMDGVLQMNVNVSEILNSVAQSSTQNSIPGYVPPVPIGIDYDTIEFDLVVA